MRDRTENDFWRLLTRTGICAALVLVFLWPAILNRQPIFSHDTSAYIRGFDAGIVWLTGKTSAWTTWVGRTTAPKQGTSGGTTTQHSDGLQSSTFIITGRSVTYGALLYLGELLGGLWATVVIQAATALAVVALTLRHLDLFSWPRLVAVSLALGVASSLPFFASFLLPDVFAGLSMLAAGHLLAPENRLTRWERVFWISLLAAAAVFHPTHLAIIALLPAAAVMTYFYNARISKSGIAALVLATCVGFASEIGFAQALDKLRGVQVVRPPVIMARIIADGPGADYLRKNCPQAGFTVCEFVNRLGPNSDAFLWDTSPSSGIYSPASVDKRRELGNEQYKFAAAVLAHDPVGQIVASLNVAIEQLKMVGLTSFLQATPDPSRIPRVHSERMVETPIGRKTFPIGFFSALTTVVAIFSFMFACAMLFQFWRMISPQLKFLGLTVILGVLSNAVICGALSGPHERYQSRLTWLFPFLALLMFYEGRKFLALHGVGEADWSWHFKYQAVRHQLARLRALI